MTRQRVRIAGDYPESVDAGRYLLRDLVPNVFMDKQVFCSPIVIFSRPQVVPTCQATERLLSINVAVSSCLYCLHRDAGGGSISVREFSAGLS